MKSNDAITIVNAAPSVTVAGDGDGDGDGDGLGTISVPDIHWLDEETLEHTRRAAISRCVHVQKQYVTQQTHVLKSINESQSKAQAIARFDKAELHRWQSLHNELQSNCRYKLPAPI